MSQKRDCFSIWDIAKVVDVACRLRTMAHLAAGEGVAVSAIDFTPAMIANLKRRAEEAGSTVADVLSVT